MKAKKLKAWNEYLCNMGCTKQNGCLPAHYIQGVQSTQPLGNFSREASKKFSTISNKESKLR